MGTCCINLKERTFSSDKKGFVLLIFQIKKIMRCSQSALSFIAVIKSSNSTDSRRAYQCIKFLVQLANKCPQAKDYLLQNSSRWQWAVQWLKRKMNEHYWAPHTSSSNEYSNSRTFQRTSSAADTLAEATALLTELEAKDGEVNTSDEVVDSESKFTGEDWEKEVMT